MARGFSSADATALTSVHYEVSARLLIEGFPVYLIMPDGKDPFISGSIQADLDTPVIQAQFRCHLGAGATNISRLMTGGVQYGARPLFDVVRPIQLETSCDVPGTGPSNWHRVFDGVIDSVEIAGDGSDTLTIFARDKISYRLQQIWIDIISVTNQGPQFGFPVTGARVDLVIQDIIDQAYSGLFPEPFRVIGAPDLALTDFWQDQGNLLDVIRRLGLLNGWDLRGKWDGQGGPDQFELTYYNPDRDLTSGVGRIVANTSGTEYIYNAISGLKIDASVVRNRIFVTPADLTRVPQMAEDATSQALYGLRSATISEDRASHIDTEAEALTLAQLILADTKDPQIALDLEMRYFWLPEVNDVYLVGPNGVLFDDFLLVGIHGYTHTFSEDGDATTVLRTRTRPAAAAKEWRRGVPRMQYSSLNEPAGPGVEGATWMVIPDDALPTVL